MGTSNSLCQCFKLVWRLAGSWIMNWPILDSHRLRRGNQVSGRLGLAVQCFLSLPACASRQSNRIKHTHFALAQA